MYQVTLISPTARRRSRSGAFGFPFNGVAAQGGDLDGEAQRSLRAFPWRRWSSGRIRRAFSRYRS